MANEHRSDVTVYLTSFRSFILGMLLVFLLAACREANNEAGNQTPVPSQVVATSARKTPAPSSTMSPGSQETHTPVSPEAAITPLAIQTLAVQPEDLAPQVITFWHPWSGQAGVELQKIIDQYNLTNPWQVTVVVESFSHFTSLEQAFESALAQGNPPSLLVAYDDILRHWDITLQGLVDLRPYIADPNWGMSSAEQADFYAEFWQQGTVYTQDSTDQKIRQLSIPFQRSEVVFYYNQSWAAEMGFAQPPKTPAELHDQACQMLNVQEGATEGLSGGIMLSTLPSSTSGREIILQPEQVLGWIKAFAGQAGWSESNGYQFNSPEALRAFEFLKDLGQKDCLYLSDSISPADDFAARRALLYLATTTDLPAVQAAFEAAGSRDEWVLLPFPAIDGVQQSVVAYGPSLIIPQTEEIQQVAAWTLLEWLVDPSNQARWVQAVGAYPTRLSTQKVLTEAMAADPHWAAGFQFLPGAQAEPSRPSWRVVRWMLGDALAELFSPAFSAAQIPTLLENLDQQASEVDHQVR